MPLDKYKNSPESHPRKQPYSEPQADASTPKKKATLGGRIFLFCFGAIFFTVGTLIVWHMGIKKLIIYDQAVNWPGVKATILHSDVASHSDSDGTTYSFEVRYRYQYEGKTYESSRYRISEMSTSDYSTHARLSNAYPVGKDFVAFVNPEDPFYAVLNRTKGWEAYFPFAFILFNVFGLFAIIAAIRGDEVNKNINIVIGSGSTRNR